MIFFFVNDWIWMVLDGFIDGFLGGFKLMEMNFQVVIFE